MGSLEGQPLSWETETSIGGQFGGAGPHLGPRPPLAERRSILQMERGSLHPPVTSPGLRLSSQFPADPWPGWRVNRRRFPSPQDGRPTWPRGAWNIPLRGPDFSGGVQDILTRGQGRGQDTDPCLPLGCLSHPATRPGASVAWAAWRPAQTRRLLWPLLGAGAPRRPLKAEPVLMSPPNPPLPLSLNSMDTCPGVRIH